MFVITVMTFFLYCNGIVHQKEISGARNAVQKMSKKNYLLLVVHFRQILVFLQVVLLQVLVEVDEDLLFAKP